MQLKFACKDEKSVNGFLFLLASGLFVSGCSTGVSKPSEVKIHETKPQLSVDRVVVPGGTIRVPEAAMHVIDNKEFEAPVYWTAEELDRNSKAKLLNIDIASKAVSTPVIKNVKNVKNVVKKEWDAQIVVYFAFNSTSLDDSGKKTIRELLADYKPNEISTARILGYADGIGSDEYNIDLGKRRGDEVKDFLVNAGVPIERIIVLSLGKDDPVETNDTPQGRALNRRVFIDLRAKPAAAIPIQSLGDPVHSSGDMSPNQLKQQILNSYPNYVPAKARPYKEPAHTNTEADRSGNVAPPARVELHEKGAGQGSPTNLSAPRKKRTVLYPEPATEEDYKMMEDFLKNRKKP